jgi:tRNA (guanine-N7-)-methyltransferase
MNETSKLRTIRSFVLRQGRLTSSQQTAINQYWPEYGLEPDRTFDPAATFGRKAPVVLEIGFGNGESLAQMAAASPEKDFIGIEVHRPGVGHLLLKIHELGLTNLRVYCTDAVEVLTSRIPDGCVAGIQVFFPDPWHKKRHNKRRLINAEFVEMATKKLSAGGIFHCATDWEDYAMQMLAELEASQHLRNLAGEGHFAERPEHRPLTKFERRGHKLGHGVWDLMFEKI